MVIITDICIECDACIDECPVEAILDSDDNPTGEEIYYVQPEKCVECVGYYEVPACAEACPTDGCIIWGDETLEQNPNRKEGEPVIPE